MQGQVVLIQIIYTFASEYLSQTAAYMCQKLLDSAKAFDRYEQ